MMFDNGPIDLFSVGLFTVQERKLLKKSMVVFVHAMFQTLLSASLANILKLSPRFTGALVRTCARQVDHSSR